MGLGIGWFVLGSTSPGGNQAVAVVNSPVNMSGFAFAMIGTSKSNGSNGNSARTSTRGPTDVEGQTDPTTGPVDADVPQMLADSRSVPGRARRLVTTR